MAIILLPKNDPTEELKNPGNQSIQKVSSETDGPSLRFYIHGRLHLIPIKNILCLEASGQYTRIYRHKGSREELIAPQSIKHYEKLLCGYGFLRVHASWLVNIAFMEEIDKTALILLGGMHVPIARRKKKEALDKIFSLKEVIG